MVGLQKLIDYIDITILNIELYTVGAEWNYSNVNNPYSRIYYITDGYGAIFHHGKEYKLRPGHIYLIPCYTTVDMSCAEAFTHYYIHFTTRMQTGMDIFSVFQCAHHADPKGSLISEVLFERLLELNPNKELTDHDANVPVYQQALEKTTILDQAKSPGNIFETNAIMRLLISAFFNDYDRLQITNTLQGLKRFENVLEYIHDNLDKHIPITKLAKMANLNSTYFSNLFTKLIGSSPVQYINKRRIEKAQQLLLGTDNTLYQIAVEIGFDDEYYFSRLFKKHVGLSPDHYRKQQQAIYQG